MKKIRILGKSHYALAVIIDNLYMLYGGDFSVEVFANIPEKENTSANVDYDIPDIRVTELTYRDYVPDKRARLYCGSIGKGRRKIVEFFQEHCNVLPGDYEILIHPSAVVPIRRSLAPGVQIGPNATLAPFAELGIHCVVSRNSSIGHHTVLEDFVTVNPGCAIAGLCRIGENSMIGAGAVILDRITIGRNSIIGAGSVVTKDIPDGVVAYGSPAKAVRSSEF